MKRCFASVGALGLALAIQILSPTIASADVNMAHANTYIAVRGHAWMDANNSHGSGHCLSCHSTFPVMLSSMVKEGPDSETDNVRKEIRDMIESRVNHWNDNVSPVIPWYPDSSHVEGSMSTESVLNATSLVVSDMSRGNELTPVARKALDLMFKRQKQDGSWEPLDFDMQPWESGQARFWTSAMAMVAVGTAPDSYTDQPGIQARIDVTRDMMKEKLTGTLPVHDQLMALWANSRVGGILSLNKKKTLQENALRLQNADGGFSLDKLTGFEKANEEQTGKSDAYATAITIIGLRSSGVGLDDSRLKKAIAWLKAQQKPDGSWPADAMGVDANFNRGIVADAGASYAKIALDMVGQWAVPAEPERRRAAAPALREENARPAPITHIH